MSDTQEVFDREYNLALERVMHLVDDADKMLVTVHISDTEELQSIMMLVCHNYNIKFKRTEKEKSYAT